LRREQKIPGFINRLTPSNGLSLSLFLLFLVSFIYLMWFGNGSFFFQENNSLFIYSVDYFRKFLSRPGGLIAYAGNLLTQGYFSALYGSLLNSALLIILCLAVKAVLKRFSYKGSFALVWILLPSLLIMIFQSQHEYSLIQTLGFLTATLLFLIATHADNKAAGLVFPVLFPLFYFLTGACALVAAGMYITYSCRYGRGRTRYGYPLIVLAVAVLTVFLFYEIILLQPLKILLRYPLILYANSRINPSLIILSVILMAYPLITGTSKPVASDRYMGLMGAGSAVLLFAAATGLLIIRHNNAIERIFRVEKMVYRQDWGSVISHFEKDPSDNIIEQFYYNLALSEKGLLCERMFFGHQSAGPMSLSLAGNRDQAFRSVYYYYGIGLINEAHHLAFELMVQHGYTPENLKMLIKTELINNNFRVAERYLDVLGKTLHYRQWAQHYCKMLYRPELVDADPELGEKIRLMPREDFFILGDDAKNIDLFLDSNPYNRKAFEYKVARLLLEKDILAVAEEVKKMKAMGYRSIPRHMDEAVVALRNYSGQSPDLAGLSSKQDTEERFVRYQRDISMYGGNRPLMERSLAGNEKNTFWYYLQFGTVSTSFKREAPADRSIY
jgi:hypothetical protein